MDGNKYSVGDSVVIVSPGYTYSCYSDWVDTNAMFHKHLFRLNASPIRNAIGEIIAMGIHPEERRMLYFIKCDDIAYIMCDKGFKKYLTYKVDLL